MLNTVGLMPNISDNHHKFSKVLAHVSQLLLDIEFAGKDELEQIVLCHRALALIRRRQYGILTKHITNFYHNVVQSPFEP